LKRGLIATALAAAVLAALFGLGELGEHIGALLGGPPHFNARADPRS
jgi:hypothetical protein